MPLTRTNTLKGAITREYVDTVQLKTRNNCFSVFLYFSYFSYISELCYNSEYSGIVDCILFYFVLAFWTMREY